MGLCLAVHRQLAQDASSHDDGDGDEQAGQHDTDGAVLVLDQFFVQVEPENVVAQ